MGPGTSKICWNGSFQVDTLELGLDDLQCLQLVDDLDITQSDCGAGWDGIGGGWDSLTDLFCLSFDVG
jgi:hypothetical protein